MALDASDRRALIIAAAGLILVALSAFVNGLNAGQTITMAAIAAAVAALTYYEAHQTVGTAGLDAADKRALIILVVGVVVAGLSAFLTGFTAGEALQTAAIAAVVAALVYYEAHQTALAAGRHS